MPIAFWWLWMILAAVFAVAEIFTAGFFLLCFGIGAAAAGFLALFGFGPGWQWAAFAVISLIAFGMSRRFAERVTKEQPTGIGADRFIGLEGVVLEEVNNIKNTGLVRIKKDEWRADSTTGEAIPSGKLVRVIGMDGTHLLVEPIKEEK